MQFAAPAKGNEKGGVEGLHGTIEDAIFRPMPNYGSLSELNAALDELANNHLDKRISGECVRDRFEHESLALRPLPAMPPSACVREPARINKFAEIIYKTNRYSTPSKYAHRHATIEIFHDRLRIVVDTIAIAEHERRVGRNEPVFEPVHFIDLLSFKHRAVVRAEVFRQRSFHHALRTLVNDYVENVIVVLLVASAYKLVT